jgi:hypothetical protein
MIAAALVAAIACGDPYLHTNPYDPLASVNIIVSGPDTIFNYTEIGQFSSQILPAMPDTAVRFAVSDSVAFAPAGGGSFASMKPPLYPATKTVSVMVMIGQVDTTISEDIDGVPVTIQTYVWRHSGSKNVVLTQRVTKIQLRCPDTHACGALSAGGIWSVWVDGFDALNQPILALYSATANPSTGTPVASFTSRDTTIASVSPVGIRVANVTALKTGTTWIVASRGALLDSLQLTVH